MRGGHESHEATDGAQTCFGPYCYDRSRVLLSRGEEEIPLPPRALALLERLLERPGEVVCKDELLKAAWDGRFVGDESLTEAICVIRHALGDDPQNPTYIRTIPRRGYLWLAPLNGAPQYRESEVRRWQHPAAVACALGLMLVVTGASMLRSRDVLAGDRQGDVVLAGTEDPPTIAVLGFENLGSVEDSYFAAGVTEEVISRLVSVSGLQVISGRRARSHSHSLASSPREPFDNAELGEDVEYVLEGAVRWAKSRNGVDRVRITPRLIRVEDGTLLWAEVYDREIEDVFAVQSEIAGKVLAELGVRLAAPERQALESPPTASLEAYQAYLRARDSHDLLGDFGEAAHLYERAIRLDPGFADAYASLSVVKGDRYRRGVARRTEDLIAIRQTLERAASLAPDKPIVRLAQGIYHINCEPDYERALQFFQPLVADYPNFASAQTAAGFAHLLLGRYEEGLTHFERAQALEPNRADHVGVLAEVYRGLRRFDAAEELWNRVITLRPSHGLTYARKAETLLAWRQDLAGARELAATSPPGFEVSRLQIAVELADGNYGAAIALLEETVDDPSSLEGPWQEVELRFQVAFALHVEGHAAHARRLLLVLEGRLAGALEDQPDSLFYSRYLARVHALLGHSSEAIELAQRLVRDNRDDGWIGPKLEETLVFVYAWSGQTDQALDLVERLLSIPYWRSFTGSRLAIEAEWLPLREEPRYHTLVNGPSPRH